MENDPDWHNGAPNDEQLEQALQELLAEPSPVTFFRRITSAPESGHCPSCLAAGCVSTSAGYNGADMIAVKTQRTEHGVAFEPSIACVTVMMMLPLASIR